jgi:hypothetical protein
VDVVVIYNQPVLAESHAEYDSEEWVRTAVEDVSEHLAAAGFRVRQLGVGRNLRSLETELAAARSKGMPTAPSPRLPLPGCWSGCPSPLRDRQARRCVWA